MASPLPTSQDAIIPLPLLWRLLAEAHKGVRRSGSTEADTWAYQRRVHVRFNALLRERGITFEGFR